LSFEPRGDAVRQSLGDLALGHDRPVFNGAGVDEVDRIAVAAKGAGSGRDIIGEYPIAALAIKLGACILDYIVRLRRKPDDECRPIVPVLRDAGQNVGILG
jgi:hypothetical protein